MKLSLHVIKKSAELDCGEVRVRKEHYEKV